MLNFFLLSYRSLRDIEHNLLKFASTYERNVVAKNIARMRNLKNSHVQYVAQNIRQFGARWRNRNAIYTLLETTKESQMIKNSVNNFIVVTKDDNKSGNICMQACSLKTKCKKIFSTFCVFIK